MFKYYRTKWKLWTVTRLDLCDVCVWTENNSHLHVEKIHFDEDFWNATKDKLDAFLFAYYLN